MNQQMAGTAYVESRARLMLRLRQLPDDDASVHRAPLVGGAWLKTLAKIGHPLDHGTQAQLTAVGAALLDRDWPAQTDLADAVAVLIADRAFRPETAHAVARFCQDHGAGWIASEIETALSAPAAP